MWYVEPLKIALHFMIYQILGLNSLYNQSFVDTLLELSDEFEDSDVDSLTTHYWLPLFTLKNKFFKPQPGTQPVGLIRSTLRIFVGVRSSDFWTFGLSDFRTCMYYVRLIWSVIRLSDLPSFPWCDAFLFSLSTILYHHSTAQRSTAYHSIAWHSIHRIQLLNHLLAPDISPATDWRWVWTSLTLTIVCLIHR